MHYGSEPERTSTRRQLSAALAVFVAALALSWLPPGAQEEIAAGLRASLLRPFIDTQVLLADLRRQEAEAEELRHLVDSLSSALARQGGLSDENRRLRELLGLAERLGPSFVPATVLRSGTAGSQSTFFLDVGSADGVREGAPVLSYNGLLGRIREAQPERAVGMDWTHPDFRASGMLEDGRGYGMVETRRGDFREADRLVLNGTPYNESFPPGALIVTSGLGGIFPRGIPIGHLGEVEHTETGWLKSYWLDPLVDPADATHVLVMVGGSRGEAVARAWAADSLSASPDTARRGGTR